MVKIQHFSTKQSILPAAALVLLVPALLFNLGLVAFYDDEAIRALVALEMQTSGNYISPTLFGELYYNKPPLYNWILLAVFEATGQNNEFTSRAVTVFFLLLYALSVYQWMKPRHGLVTALALLTCGRILFWDSMLGLIDICFSWVIFLMFMLVFQKGEKQEYGQLFFWSYLLAAIGYLLKGLPAVLFLGTTLLTYFIWQKKTKRLFSWMHAAGAMIFISIVGGYYYLYARQNGLAEIIQTVFHESAKRTFIEYGWTDTVRHLFTFPFEMWYHFLPWTLLFICFFRKDFFKILKENKFITWNALLFLTTLLPFWASVEVYPRYLFMHVPLLFSVFFYFYYKNKKENGWQAKTVEMVFFAASCVAIVLALFPLGWEQAKDVPYRIPKSIGLAALSALFSYLYFRWKNQRMIVFALVLLTTRISYNFFILPSRLKIECSTLVRQTTLQAAKMANEHPIYIYKNSLGFQPLTGYYFTRETGHILKKDFGEIKKDAFYLVHPGNYDASIFKKYGEVKIKWKCGTLWFMKKRPLRIKSNFFKN